MFLKTLTQFNPKNETHHFIKERVQKGTHFQNRSSFLLVIIVSFMLSLALWFVTHDNTVRLSDKVIIYHFHTGNKFLMISGGLGLLLSIWGFFEYLFSKRSFVPMYRLRRLLQGLTTEISNLSKKIPDEAFHGVPIEFWRSGADTYIKVFTTGFVRDGLKEQLSELIQDYLISESLGSDKDCWTYIKDTKIGAGYVLTVFGETPNRSILDLEDYENEN